jgi:pimeloyl-ACP methyl ester carboxylesterase
MSKSESAADGGLQRLVLIDVVDVNGQRVCGATVALFLDGQLAGSAITPTGRATFQISSLTVSVSVEASYESVSKRVDLASNAQQHVIELPIDTSVHVVVLIHGINTRAAWLGVVGPTLKASGLIPAPAGYGVYGVLRFLLPFDWLRRRAIKTVETKIRLAIALHHRDVSGPKKLSVVAHSFGTYVLARILAERFDIAWDRIIFCGSVCPNDYPFENYYQRFAKPLLNDIGTKDVWPAFAESVTWGYGSVGAYGFQSPAVEDRWHKGLAHSDFLNGEFCNEFWIPFLTKGEIKPGDAPDPAGLPRTVRALTRFPLKWVVWPGVIWLAYELCRLLLVIAFYVGGLSR